MRKQKMQVIHAALTQTSRAGCSISIQGKDQFIPKKWDEQKSSIEQISIEGAFPTVKLSLSRDSPT